jgi:tripartite-type tricarboxylate transporter receptor subunit TctC
MTRALKLLASLMSCALVCAAPHVAFAQKPQNLPGGYPSKPIKILIPLAAGGGVDTLARTVGQKLSERWGVGVVVDNQPSAGGVVAMNMLAQAAPDGYTLLSTGSQMELVTVYYRAGWNKDKPGIAPNFDALKTFEPIVEMASQPYLLVVPASLPVKSIKELIALAKSKPGTLNYSSAGIGTPGHLGHELFNSLAGVKIAHVPYKGSGGAAMTDLLAGRVQLTFVGMITATNLVKSGSVRALGVTSQKRIDQLPDLPTIAESGMPEFEMSNAFGLFGTGKIPSTILSAINREVTQLLFLPDMKTKLLTSGMAPEPAHTPAQYRAKLERNAERWAAVVESSGIKPE